MRRSGVRGTALVALGAAVGLMFATVPALPADAQTAPATPSAGVKLSPTLAELALPSVQSLAPAEQAQALDVPVSGAGSLIERDGRVLVDVRVTAADAATVDAITAAGATVTFVSERYAVVTAEIAPADLDALAALPAVLSVQEVLEPILGGAGIATSDGDVEAQAGTCPSGANVSEADTQLRAALAKSAFDLDGTGVKIGVLSDSYDTSATAITHAAGDVASGDLPGASNPCGHTTPVTVLSDFASGTDEGRAMLQAIHDVVPGAQLAFSTAIGGETVMAQHIHDLQAWGADIIVDDVTYFAEPFYQDGIIAVAVNDVTALGVSYFSSAGNSNLIFGGDSVGSYEAPAFRPTPCPASVAAFVPAPDSCHDFIPLAGTDTGWDFNIANGGRLRIDFQYAEPRNGVTHNFDIYLLNAANDVIGFSRSLNLTNQIPFELIQAVPWSGPAASLKLVIARVDSSGTPPIKFLLISPSGVANTQYTQSSNGDVVGPSIFGHNGAKNAGSTAAVPFDDSTRAESFTSHGPVTLHFGPVVGSTPAAPLGAPEVVAKPDFAATDGARNSFFGSDVAGVKRFYGTSQAAPHAAAVAALLLQWKPSLTPSEVRDLLAGYAESIQGEDQNSIGAGLIDAFMAVQGVGLPKVKSFSPATGPVGTEIVIKGYNLNGLEGISFNGTPATFDDDPNPNVATATVPAGATTGKITATTNGGASVSVGDFTVGVAAGGRFTGITPVRALDTRNTGPCVSTTPRNLTLGGQFGVQADATAVALNVTVVSPAGAGFLTAWPAGQTQPLASNLNFVAGQTVPNMVTVKLGAGGAISLYANNGCPHVVVDVAGYYTGPGAAGPGGFTGITPVRVLDTRDQFSGPCVGSTPRGLGIAHPYGSVPSNATAVALNVTVVTPSGDGFFTVWPAGETQPLASNLNFVAGQIVPNMVTVKLEGGGIHMASNNGCPHVVVDVAGYYEGGGPAGPGGFTGITPVRALDTRNVGSGPCVGTTPRNLTLRPGLVPAGASAVALNVTVVNPSGDGYFTVWPAGDAQPFASNLNFVTGQTVPNMVTAKLGTGGAIRLFANNGCPHVVVDVAGYYTSP